MKLNFPYSEPPKYNQNLLKEILEENTSFNTLDINSINEILLVFKISDSANLMDRQMKIAKIKQKLLDVIIDQKDQSVNYLVLPKFNNISEGARSVLKEVMSTTWPTYLNRQAEEEKNKKYSRYFCRANNIKQTEEFHLGLFNMIKSMFFYQNPSFYRMMPGYPPMMPMPPTPSAFPPYSGISNQDMQGAFYPLSMSTHQHQQPTTSAAQSSLQSQKIKIEDKGGQGSEFTMKEQYKKKQGNKKRQKGKQKDEGRVGEKETTLNSGAFKNFASCVCKGKFSESQRYFQCEQCQKKYHLNCLNIPSHATQKPGVKKRCPQCYLKNSNSLYLTIEQLQTFWSDDRELHKQRITIKAKKSKEIQQKKYSIQLRFMKIQGRTMYDWDSTGQLKLEPGISAPKPILNQVLIKDQVITKGNGEDVKISLDCMKPPQSRNQDKKPILLFVAVNIVQQKSVQQILQGNYQYFQQNYLDKFLKDKDQLKIQVFDINFKLFNKPVRGADCQHPDLYDLEEFANHCIDLHNDLCFCCTKRCRTFKIDGKIQAEIRKIKETIPNQEDYPQAIYYQKDGTFKWKDDTQNHQQKMQNEQENNPHVRKYPKKQDSNQNESNMNIEQSQQISSLEMSELQDSQDDQQQKSKSKNKSNKNSKTFKIRKQNKQ